MVPERIDPTTLPGRPCSIAAALELVGDRWSLLIVREVGFGNHRFTQIARNTGAPTDRLAARLKDLVAGGILERRATPGERDGYYLTAAGQDLSAVTGALLRWGDKWVVTEPPMALRHHRHKLRAQTRCATCGEVVEPEDVTRTVTVEGWDLAGRIPPA